MKTAVIHEWLVAYAGSERVCEQMLRLYPEAELFSLVAFLSEELRGMVGDRSLHTSFLQHLPFARQKFRSYLPLMPFAVEQFDLSDYDLILSSSHAVAKGVLTRADQLHISYVHTPIRYAWDLQQQYLKGAGLQRGVGGLAVQAVLHYLRLWDLASANRVDHFVANSHYVARRIWKTYRRRAKVIYPPVAIEKFEGRSQREDFYFTLSRFVPYKRVDLTVAAFTRLGLPLVVIGEGGDFQRIRALAGENVRLLGQQPDAVVVDYMQRCKAFVFAAAEDFGISVVEAQAAGAPVIAYGRGGVRETVIPGKTGLFFPDQTVESLMEAVKQFEAKQYKFYLEDLRENAERFSTERFCQQFREFTETKWAEFRRADGIEYSREETPDSCS